MDVRATKRVQKELERFSTDGSDDGLQLQVQSLLIWHVSFKGAPSTLYAGEEFTLRIAFTNQYPMEAPEVVFLLPAPVHEHIYGNGHICLNILGNDWSPALTVSFS